MRRPRFTIRSLLAVVLFVAIAVAALRGATDLWDSGTFGLTLLTILTAVLLAVHRTGDRRAYWVGFALFGWSYVVASLVPSVEARLPTTRGLAYLDSKVPGRSTSVGAGLLWLKAIQGDNAVTSIAFSPQGGSLATSSQGVVRLWNARTGTLLAGPNGTSENFVKIGHILMALVVASLGGLLSRSLHDSRPGQPTSNPEGSCPSDADHGSPA